MDNKDLFQNAKKGNWEQIISQYKDDTNISSLLDENGKNLLWYAVDQQNYEAIKFCLENGISPDGEYENGNSYINHLIVDIANQKIIQIFRTFGVNLEGIDEELLGHFTELEED